MAKKPKGHSQETSLSRLAPGSLPISVDGQEIRIALNREENAILNVVLAAQVRAFIQSTIKRYRDADNLLTPRELRDIAGAFSDLAKASGEIYVGNEDLSASKGKKEVPDTDDFSFDVTPKNESATKDASAGEESDDAAGAEGNAKDA